MDPERLPEAFVARMCELLGTEAAAFLDSYRRPAQRAVRANPLKLDPAALPGLLGIDPDPVPWCPGDGTELNVSPPKGLGPDLESHRVEVDGQRSSRQPTMRHVVARRPLLL